MGMSARATIWVGISSKDFDFRQILAQLPSDLFDEEGYDWFEDKDIARLTEKYGCFVVKIFCSEDEDEVGVGVRVFRYDWDDGPVLFSMSAIEADIKKAKDRLTALLLSVGITSVPRVWIVTDFC